MHTIELDPVTDQTLSQLAARQGKTPDEWLQDCVPELIALHAARSGLPDLEAFRAKLPYQNESAGEFCRAMRDGDRY